MKILVLNGPNLNMLGVREPHLYGNATYKELCNDIAAHATRIGVEVEIYQSNHEGELVDKIQAAYFEKVDGIVFNPAAYTHTSVAILDAVKAVSIPTVEVHISDVESRDEFRRVSFIREACVAMICGRGLKGYLDAIDLLMEQKK